MDTITNHSEGLLASLNLAITALFHVEQAVAVQSLTGATKGIACTGRQIESLATVAHQMASRLAGIGDKIGFRQTDNGDGSWRLEERPTAVPESQDARDKLYGQRRIDSELKQQVGILSQSILQNRMARKRDAEAEVERLLRLRREGMEDLDSMGFMVGEELATGRLILVPASIGMNPVGGSEKSVS